MLQPASYPGLGTLRVVNQLRINRCFQSLRVTECADRERWRGQVKERDQPTDARGGGRHRANLDFGPLRLPDARDRDIRHRAVELARIPR